MISSDIAEKSCNVGCVQDNVQEDGEDDYCFLRRISSNVYAEQISTNSGSHTSKDGDIQRTGKLQKAYSGDHERRAASVVIASSRTNSLSPTSDIGADSAIRSGGRRRRGHRGGRSLSFTVKETKRESWEFARFTMQPL